MPRLSSAALFALLILVSSNALADGTSKSYSDWRIRGSTAELHVSFAPHDFATAFPDLDVNHDLKIDSAELTTGVERVGAMVVSETELSAARAKGETKERCRAGAPRVIPIGEPLQEVQVQVTFDCALRIGAFELRAHYLPTLEPPHVGVATIATVDTTAQHVFTRAAPTFVLDLRPAPLASALADSLVRGMKAALTSGLVLFLSVLLFPLGLKRAAGVFAVFFGVDLIAIIAGGGAAHAAVAAAPFLAAGAVAWAGAEALFAEAPALSRRLLGTAVFAAAFGLDAASHASVSAPLPERIAFAIGALVPAIGAFVVVRIARMLVRRERAQRPLAIASLVASAALLILALR
jgi:hypothetical protein